MVSPMSFPRTEGIARYAREHDWNLMIQDRLGYHPLAWNGDGVIATIRSDPVTFSCISRLMKRGVPVVDLTISRPDVAVPRVTSDHTAIGHLAAEHFRERNFRNAVWFSTGWGAVHAMRFKGLQEGLERAPLKWVLAEERVEDWSPDAEGVGDLRRPDWLRQSLRDEFHRLADRRVGDGDDFR